MRESGRLCNLFGVNGDPGISGFSYGGRDIVPGVKLDKILGPLADPGCTGTDQRGVARPRGAGCDIGAFER